MKSMWLIIVALAAGISVAQIADEPVKAEKIIPVSAWPKVIATADKQISNASKEDCIKAGYRLLPAVKPATPAGKRIKSESIVQDAQDAAACKYEIVYESAPIVTPEVTTNVLPSRVKFQFSTNGQYRGVIWLDAPATNGVGKE